jgi:hypothetical protein
VVVVAVKYLGPTAKVEVEPVGSHPSKLASFTRSVMVAKAAYAGFGAAYGIRV